jgi:uncharacterized membrane protein YjfL (UPF0719 family)
VQKFIDACVAILLQYGLAGVVMLVLGYALYRVSKLYVEAQEKRITEAQATTSALVSSSIVLNRVADILQQDEKN